MPLDGSTIAEYAVIFLVGGIQAATLRDEAHAGTASWHIMLFTVAESRALLADSRAYLNQVEARLQATGLPAGVRISTRVRLGSAPGALVAMADHGMRSPDIVVAPFDLVVLATHGRGGWAPGYMAASRGMWRHG